MVMIGGAAMDRILAGIAEKAQGNKTLKMGFQDGATYPINGDGEAPFVAQVAFWNEFGTKSSPPRPFFRPMIAAKSPRWGDQLGGLLVAHDYDVTVSLGLLGTRMVEQLQESIKAVDAPALSPITLMIRKMRSEGGPNFKMTGTLVGEAARRVADGEDDGGQSTKPLIDTGVMWRDSITREVE